MRKTESTEVSSLGLKQVTEEIKEEKLRVKLKKLPTIKKNTKKRLKKRERHNVTKRCFSVSIQKPSWPFLGVSSSSFF